MAMFDKIKEWFGRREETAKEAAEGGEPVATPPQGVSDEPQRETSTNAQTSGAAEEPWPGNE